MAHSGYTCIRRLFCWFNFSLWLAGCFLFGAGLWLKFAFEGYISLLPQYALLSADSLSIFVGVFTIVFAFIGCCSSWLKNRCMLITYFSCMIVMFEIEISLGILAFIFRAYLGNTLRIELQDGIKYHYNTSDTVATSLVTIWDRVQTELKCCGVVNSADWYHINAWPNESWVPDSCCVNISTNCGRSHVLELYSRSCADQVYIWFIERLYIIGVIGLVVAFIQLFGFIASMLLFCTEKKKHISPTYERGYNI